MTSQATPDCPWLGLAHFTKAEREYFYGRDAEIRELCDRVRRAPLTVLYGVSGFGKSSLLGAGLIPAMENEGHVVTLLRRCYDDLPTRPLVDDVIKAAGGSEADAGMTLWEFYHRREGGLSVPDAPAPILILDQFEEIFIRGEDRSTADKTADEAARATARDFLTQLADLVENRPPASLRERLENGSAEEKRTLLRRFDFQARSVRVVLTLREDFLARLERWRRLMPGMMEHRVELRLLSGPQAYRAVYEPGTKREGRPPIIPPDVARAIVRAAAGAGPEVPLEEINAVPPILSLLCERLNARRLAANPQPESVSSADFDAGEASRILGSFYEEKLRPHPAALRALLEEELVSDAGFREIITLESAVASLRAKVPDAADRLRQLVDDRILVIEDRGGLARVEFTHDTLARLALERRAQRRARARRLRTLRWAAAAVVITGGSLFLTAWALREKRQAEKQTRIAEEQSALARQRQAEAEVAKTHTEAALAEAKAQKERAIAARAQAEDILQYLVSDLRKKLENKAQLSVLQDIEKQISAHYEKMGIDNDDGDLKGRRALAYQNQALTHRLQGDFESATHSVEQALKILHELAKQNPRNLEWQKRLSDSYELLAKIQHEKGDLENAQRSYQQSLEIISTIAQRDSNLHWQRELAEAHNYIGDILQIRGDLSHAQQSFQREADIRSATLQREPDNLRFQDDLAQSLIDMGNLQLATGDVSGAVRSCENSVKLRRGVAQRSPNNTEAQAQRKLCVSYIALCGIQRAMGDVPGAERSIQEAIAGMVPLTKKEPENRTWQRDLMLIHNEFIWLQRKKGDLKGALDSSLRALEIGAYLANRDLADMNAQRDLMNCYVNLASVFEAQRNWPQAAGHFEKALSIYERLRGENKLPNQEIPYGDAIRQGLQRVREPK